MTRETNKPADAGGAAAVTSSLPLGAAAGLELGLRLGDGLIFADLRYNRDLGVSKVEGNALTYTRSRYTLSLGYQFALFAVK
jgi:hypothetical protein